jgi:hypothetical protein
MKEQPTKVGQSVPLIQARREGIKKFTHVEACEMQTTEAYLGLLRERGKRGLPLERVYRQLFNKNLYLTAYGKIYRNKGASTKGVNDDTVDGMSLDKIDAIIEALRQERYQWAPAKRIYIPKRNGKKRPLGLPVWSDKLLAEVIRMILDAFYDIQLPRALPWLPRESRVPHSTARSLLSIVRHHVDHRGRHLGLFRKRKRSLLMPEARLPNSWDTRSLPFKVMLSKA